MNKSYILLIEPDRIFARTIQKALESNGFKVKVFHCGQDALIAANTTTPSLVVCEVQLVGHSGIEFLYELRSYSDWQNIPVIINSIVPPSEFVDCRQGLSRDLAVAAYLYKPHTSLKQLIKTISLTLNSVANEAT